MNQSMKTEMPPLPEIPGESLIKDIHIKGNPVGAQFKYAVDITLENGETAGFIANSLLQTFFIIQKAVTDLGKQEDK